MVSHFRLRTDEVCSLFSQFNRLKWRIIIGRACVRCRPFYEVTMDLVQGVQPDRRADGAGGVQLHHPRPSLPRHLLQEAPYPSCRPTRGT